MHHSKSMTSVCRLCFMERVQLEFIFECESKYLSEWIEKLTSLKIINIPNAPASLCSECKSTLEGFDAFREMCIANDVVFNDTFCQNNIKPNDFTGAAVIKVECIEDQQIEIAATEDEQSWIKCEIIAEQGNTDVASTELLLDVFEAKFQDVHISTETDGIENAQNRSDVVTSENTIAGDLSSYKAGDLECKVCKRTESKMHIMTHKAKGLFQCYMCEQKFNRSTKCLNHVNWHLRPKLPTLAGNYCKICMKLKSKMHVITHKAEGLYVCKFCEKIFKNAWSLNMHMKHFHIGKNAHKITNEEEVPAPVEVEHNTQINNTDKRIYSSFEGNKFTTMSNVEEQFENHKYIDRCKICEKNVSKLHIKTHKAKALFVCHICSKMYKKYDYLSKHINSHKKKKITRKGIASENNKPHVSMACESKTSEDPTETSSSSTAPETVVQAKGKHVITRSYECKLCATFVTKLHAESHKAEGFQCPVCQCYYNKFDCYSKHIKTHRDKGKYACTICGKVFSNTFGVTRHQKIHNVNLLDAN